MGIGILPKSMIGIPWRVAMEMARRKWVLRSAIIWHRKHALTEAVIDRPRRSYENIFMREMQGDGGFQVIYLFRESIRETCQSSHLHPHGEVLPFDVTGRDMLGIRIPLAYLGYNLDDWAWGVPFIPELPIVTIQLRQLREVNISSKTLLHGFAVEVERIGCQLNPVRRPLV
jgi:hypothetical protein